MIYLVSMYDGCGYIPQGYFKSKEEVEEFVKLGGFYGNTGTPLYRYALIGRLKL